MRGGLDWMHTAKLSAMASKHYSLCAREQVDLGALEVCSCHDWFARV